MEHHQELQRHRAFTSTDTLPYLPGDTALAAGTAKVTVQACFGGSGTLQKVYAWFKIASTP